MDSSQICFDLISRMFVVLLACVWERFRDHCQRWRLSRILVRINREQLDLGVTCPNRGLLLLLVVWNCVVAVWDVCFGTSLITLLINNYHLTQSATFLHVNFFVFGFWLGVLRTGASFEVGARDGPADVVVGFQLREGSVENFIISIRRERTHWLFGLVFKRLLLIIFLLRCYLLLLIISVRGLRFSLVAVLFLWVRPDSFTSTSAFSAIYLLATFIQWVGDHLRFTWWGPRFNWRQFSARSRLLLYLLRWLLSFKKLLVHNMYLRSWCSFSRWANYQIWGDQASLRYLSQHYIVNLILKTSLTCPSSLIVFIHRCWISQAASVLTE